MTNFTPRLRVSYLNTIAAGCLALLAPFASTAQPDTNRQLVQTGSASVTSARRVALVIGNGAYTNAPGLKNPPNDARDMAAMLKTLGFDVTSGVNLNQREMKRVIREFGMKLKGGGSGLFYYAGHGVQSRGRNYLIPVDAIIQSEAEVEDSGVDAALVLNFMDDAQNGLNIVILDACRNNPFARSFRSANDGLAQVDAPTGTLIAYATAPGRVASDGVGQNGLYTSELLKQMQVPGVSITDTFMRVRAEVMKQTGNKQVPWEASSLVGSFYFIGGPAAPAPSAATSKIDPTAFELSYWDTIKNSQNADDFKTYLQRYPSGQFTDLAKNRISDLETVAKSVESSPAASRSDSTSEVAFWDYIKNSNNVEDFQAYLKRFPNGTFTDLANNRIKTLTATLEKDAEDKRLAGEAVRPIRTFRLSKALYKGFTFTLDLFSLWTIDWLNLVITKSAFRFESNNSKLKAEWLSSCNSYSAAKTDGVQIREIREPGDPGYYRFFFASASEAAEALGEIKRICKANP